MHRLTLLLPLLLPGCWVTPAEVEQKIRQDPDPEDEETGDTGVEEDEE